jgi:hypothetical protein
MRPPSKNARRFILELLLPGEVPAVTPPLLSVFVSWVQLQTTRCRHRAKLYQSTEALWIVRIRGFGEERDRERLIKVGSRWGNGHFRFVGYQAAWNKFQQLRALPEYATEETTAVERSKKQSERMKAMRDSGQMALRPGDAGKKA